MVAPSSSAASAARLSRLGQRSAPSRVGGSALRTPETARFARWPGPAGNEVSHRFMRLPRPDPVDGGARSTVDHDPTPSWIDSRQRARLGPPSCATHRAPVTNRASCTDAARAGIGLCWASRRCSNLALRLLPPRRPQRSGGSAASRPVAPPLFVCALALPPGAGVPPSLRTAPAGPPSTIDQIASSGLAHGAGFTILHGDRPTATAIVAPATPCGSDEPCLPLGVGHRYELAVGLQCVLGALLPLPDRVAWQPHVRRQRVGRLTGATAAADPLLAWACTRLRTETLYSLRPADRRRGGGWRGSSAPRPGRALGVGITWGLAALDAGDRDPAGAARHGVGLGPARPHRRGARSLAADRP